MAKIIRPTWRSPGPLGRKVTHVAYGYQLMVNGQRERKVSSDWLTEQAAMTALNDRLRDMEAGQLGKPAQRTLEELAKEYLQYKRDQGKRTVDGDQRILEGRLYPALGKDVNVRTITAQVLAQYEKRRAGEVSAYTVANELAVLRHMLRLGKRWGYVASVPEITLPKKPEGRRCCRARRAARYPLGTGADGRAGGRRAGEGDRERWLAFPTFTVAFSEAGAALGEFSDSWVDTLDKNRIQAGIWEDADRAFSVLARRIVDFVERN